MNPKRTLVPWTPGEDALICRLRNKHCDYDEIAEKLPHRTLIAVRRRVAHLITVGRIASQRAAWTAEEDAKLCELRGQNVSLPGIVPHFEGRTAAAIAHRIQQLRLEGRIGDLNTPPESRARWTDQEEAVIVQQRERGATLDEIASKLPQRTRGAVAVRVQELLEAEEIERAPNAPHSMRPWVSAEDELVTVMRRAEKPLEEIATALGRSQPSVSSRIAQRIRKGEVGLLRANSDKRQHPATGATEMRTDSPEVLKRVQDNLSLVEMIAGQLMRQLAHAKHDDLLSAGREALVELARRYDPSLGASFRLFASSRLEGAMRDEMRRVMGGPRRSHGDSGDAVVAEKRERLAGKHSAGLASAQAQGLLAQLGVDTAGDFMAVSPKTLADAASQRKQELELLEQCIAALPADEAMIIRRHYLDGVPIDPLADELGISRMKARTLRQRGYDRLQKRLARAVAK